jgi:hypothetical protein
MITLSAADDTLVRPSPAAAPSACERAVLAREACEPALAAMRAELEEYGALLNLLDRQQTAILDRAWGSLETVQHMIAAQQQLLRARRLQRGRAIAALAPEQPVRTLSQLTPHIPPVMRPLAEALTVEAARLKKVTTRRIQHNERMLARARQLAAGPR